MEKKININIGDYVSIRYEGDNKNFINEMILTAFSRYKGSVKFC